MTDAITTPPRGPVTAIRRGRGTLAAFPPVATRWIGASFAIANTDYGRVERDYLRAELAAAE